MLPPFFLAMLERGMTGEKAGQGFYKRVKQPNGESEILTIDPATLEYGPKRAAADRVARRRRVDLTDVRERVRALFAAKDKAGSLLRDTLAPDPRLHSQRDAVDRLLGRRRGPRDAMGVRLGAGAVRAD